MANQPFDRQVINQYERPLSQDINFAQSQLDRSLRDVLRFLFSSSGGTINSGFVQNSFRVTQSSPLSMSVLISPGFGFEDNPADVPSAVGGVTGVDDLSPYKPLVLSALQSIAVDAAPSAGNERIDIIEAQVVDRRLENPTSRDVFSPATGVFTPNLVNKTLAFYLDGQTGRVVTPNPSVTGIGYKVGATAPTGTATPPLVTAGYVKIAEILVSSGVTTIVDADITDSRTQVNPTPGPLTITTAQLVDLAVTTAKIGNLAVTTAKIDNLAVTAAKIANQTITAAQISNSAGIAGSQLAAAAGILKSQLVAVGQQVSSSTGSFTTTSMTFVDVTNLTVTITTTGRPIFIALQPESGGSGSLSIDTTSGGGDTASAIFEILRNSSMIFTVSSYCEAIGSTVVVKTDPPGSVWGLDIRPAGTYTYTVKARSAHSGTTVRVTDCVLVAYEL